MMDLISSLLALLPGLVIAGGLMAFIYKRDAVDWEKLAAVYGREVTGHLARRRFNNMILYSEGRPAKSYKGVVTIDLHPDGIGLKPFPFLVPFQKPIFVPFADIEGWKQTWYLDSKSTELAFRKAPQMRLIMPTSQVDWIRSVAEDGFSVSEDRPPHGHWPWATYVSALVFGVLTLGVISAVLFRYFSSPGEFV
ncbi:MAG: hypothetical protein ACK4P2_10665 [Hyphomonas sp.]